MSQQSTASQWFQTLDKPTESQFNQLFNYLRWKDEQLAITDIIGLSQILANKQDVGQQLNISWGMISGKPTDLATFSWCNDRFYTKQEADSRFYASSNPNGFITNASLSGYATTIWADGRFQPIENQRLSSGNNVTFRDVHADRGNGTGVIYLGNQNQYFYWDGFNYVVNASGDKVVFHQGNRRDNAADDARFHPLENQRLSTGNNVIFRDVYADRGNGTGALFFGGNTSYIFYNGTDIKLGIGGNERLAWHDGNLRSNSENDARYTTYNYVISSFLTISEAANRYYLKPVGNINQYLRGDGSLANFPIAAIPSLQQVTELGGNSTDQTPDFEGGFRVGSNTVTNSIGGNPFNTPFLNRVPAKSGTFAMLDDITLAVNGFARLNPTGNQIFNGTNIFKNSFAIQSSSNSRTVRIEVSAAGLDRTILLGNYNGTIPMRVNLVSADSNGDIVINTDGVSQGSDNKYIKWNGSGYYVDDNNMPGASFWHTSNLRSNAQNDARFQPLENQRLSTTNTVIFRDVYADRGNNTGVIWFGSAANNRYLYFDGSNYVVNASGDRIVWHSGNLRSNADNDARYHEKENQRLSTGNSVVFDRLSVGAGGTFYGASRFQYAGVNNARLEVAECFNHPFIANGITLEGIDRNATGRGSLSFYTQQRLEFYSGGLSVPAISINGEVLTHGSATRQMTTYAATLTDASYEYSAIQIRHSLTDYTAGARVGIGFHQQGMYGGYLYMQGPNEFRYRNHAGADNEFFHTGNLRNNGQNDARYVDFSTQQNISGTKYFNVIGANSISVDTINSYGNTYLSLNANTEVYGSLIVASALQADTIRTTAFGIGGTTNWRFGVVDTQGYGGNRLIGSVTQLAQSASTSEIITAINQLIYVLGQTPIISEEKVFVEIDGVVKQLALVNDSWC